MQLTVSNTAGYEDTVLWNPYGNEGMGYNNFVCVESVKVWSYVRYNSSISYLLCMQLITFSNEHYSHTHFSHLFQFDPVTLDGGASWTGDMSLSAGDL